MGLAWRRSLQLRVVTLTLGLSLAVILVLGFVLTSQITDRILEVKVRAATEEIDRARTTVSGVVGGEEARSLDSSLQLARNTLIDRGVLILIALSLVIDSSTSMEQRMATAQQAAIGFVKRLTVKDVAQVVDFDSQPIVLQPFTSDSDALERAIRRTSAGGSTSLYNAVYVALSDLRTVRAASTEDIRRQAIVLLSDGEDTSSLVEYEEVLTLAKKSEVIVYAIGLRSRTDTPTRGWNEAEFVLKSLAQETGGQWFFVDDVNALEAIYAQIADELANQYTLGYTSKNLKQDGAWRRIMVKMTRPNTSARTKSGYFGPKAVR